MVRKWSENGQKWSGDGPRWLENGQKMSRNVQQLTLEMNESPNANKQTNINQSIKQTKQ